MNPTAPEWRTCEAYPRYEVNEEGHIRVKVSQKVLKPGKTNGYLNVRLTRDLEDGETKLMCVRLHREVAKAWLPNPENKEEVNHINGAKDDNRVVNLEWTTKSENMTKFYNSDKKILKMRMQPLKFESDDEILYFYSYKAAAQHFEVALGTVWGIPLNQANNSRYRWRKRWFVTKITGEEYLEVLKKEAAIESGPQMTEASP